MLERLIQGLRDAAMAFVIVAAVAVTLLLVEIVRALAGIR